MVYLDNAATTYPKPECVLKALDEANRNAFNSGRGGYNVARHKTKIIDDVRNKLLKLNNIHNGKVILLPSATIALNSIIFGIDFQKGDNIYISPFEHNSIVRAVHELKKRIEINIEIIPFDKSTWELDEEKLSNMFVLKKPKAVLISHISNVTGYVLPYEKIFKFSSKYESINLLDCSQSYGVELIKDTKNVSYIVFAAHKSLYASFGIAGYIKLKEDILKPFLYGGTGSDSLNLDMPLEFPNRYESGSLNIVAISGLNVSLDWLKEQNIIDKEIELTSYLISNLRKLNKIKLFLPKDETKCVGVVSIGVDGYLSDEVGQILNDEFDICVRTGFHCASLVHDFIDSKIYNGTVRISLGYFNSKEDIDVLIKALKSL